MTQARTVVTLQIRRDSATAWNSADPILAAGEFGYDTTNAKFKIGNGTSNWTALDYSAVTPGELAELAQDAVAALILDGTNVGVSVTYDDTANKFSFEVGDQFPSHTTDDLTEGTANKYFTDLRAQTAVAQDIADAVSNAALGSTDDLAEGINNLYFTNQRAKDAVASDISTAVANLVDSAPSLLNTLNELAAAINDDENFAVTVATNITNAIDALDTDAIEEGTTNQYFTNQRALNATASAYDASGAASTAESSANTYTDNAINALTTYDIPEGTGPAPLYFTDERAQDAVGNAVGTGLTYTDASGEIKIDDTVVATLSGTQTLSNKTLHNPELDLTLSEALTISSSGTVSTYSATAVPGVPSVIGMQNGEAPFCIDGVAFENGTVIPSSTIVGTCGYSGGISAGQMANILGWQTTTGPTTYSCNPGDSLSGQTCTHTDSVSAFSNVSGNIYSITNPTTAGYNSAANNGFAGLTFESTPYTGLIVGSSQNNGDIVLEFAENPQVTFSNGTVATVILQKNISSAELGYLNNVTSDIQPQLNSKLNLSDASTTNITEGTRLYFTDERAQDAVGNAVGTGLTYTDSTGEIKVTPDTYDAYGSAAAVASNLSSHESDTSTHGVGTIVGTTETQTLSNKTLSSPSLTGNAFAENLTISGDLVVSGTTTTVNTQTLAVEDNLLYLNAELDRNVLNATHDTTTVEYEVDSLSGVTAGEAVRITGITPSDYNIASSDNITVLSTRTSGGKHYFTVTKTVSVSYTSGGVAHFKRDVNIDLGFAGGYNDGTYHHAGLFRDASDSGKWKFFQGYAPEPDENINIDTSDTSFALAPIVVSGIESVDATFTGTVTLPAGTVTNIMLAGSITNAKLTNSKVTLGTTDVSLGATATTITGLSSVSSASFTGDLTGNASTATKLAATKNINGVAFDGSADITVTADATTLTGTSLNSTVVGSSLTSVGTISTGVWNGSVIGASYIDTAIARLAGPTFTGTVSAPTPTAGDDSTKVATTAYVQADNLIQYVTVSGTSATIDSTSHKFKVIVCTSSSAVTISIPTDASDNWPIGSYVNVRQMGTGQVTVSAATPATTTVVATDSQLKTRVQYSEIVLEKTAANTWLVAGDTTA